MGTTDRWSSWVNAWTARSLPGVGAAILGWWRPAAPVEAPPATVDTLTAQRVSRTLDEAADAMSDAQLCRAWRLSFSSLTEARSPVERLAVVLQRQSYLDAFEARDRDGLQRWLASGARASAGPEDFLTRTADRRPHRREP